MRFVRPLAVAAALVFSGQAEASIKFFGTTSADAYGNAEANFALNSICYSCKITVSSSAPASISTELLYTFLYTPAHPATFAPFYQQFTLNNYPQSTSNNSATMIYRMIFGSSWQLLPGNQRSRVTPISLDSAKAIFQTAPDTKIDYSITVSPAPEPATWALMILGFGGVGAAVRRRRLKAAAQAISA